MGIAMIVTSGWVFLIPLRGRLLVPILPERTCHRSDSSMAIVLLLKSK